MVFNQIEKVNIPVIIIKPTTEIIQLPKIKIKNHPITFKTNSFNQNDFI
jgi:hypothetical protein